MAEMTAVYELPKNRRGALRLVSSGHSFTTMQLTKQIRKDLGSLKLPHKGADRGALEQPLSNSPGPSADELPSTRYNRDVANRCAALCVEALNRHGKTVAEAAISPDEMDFGSLVSRAGDDIGGAKMETNQDRVTRTKACEDAARQMDWFRAKEGLPENSHHGKSVAIWAGSLCACALLEATPNAFVFGDGDQLGALGGGMAAGALGMMSSFTGALMAFGGRDLKLKSWLSRTSGLVQVTSGLAIAGLLSLLAAHYRNGLQADPVHAMQVAASTIRINLMPPSIDLKGGSMLGWTLLWTIVAYWKTLDTWGAVPGYRRKSVAVEKASAALERLRLEFQSIMEQVRERFHDLIDSKEEVVRDKANRADAALRDSNAAIYEYNSRVDAVADCHHAALLGFWETNLAVRRTPAPPHFFIDPPLNAPVLMLDPSLVTAVDKIKAAYVLVQERAHAAKAEIDRMIREALEWIGAPPPAHTPVSPLLGGPSVTGVA